MIVVDASRCRKGQIRNLSLPVPPKSAADIRDWLAGAQAMLEQQDYSKVSGEFEMALMFAPNTDVSDLLGRTDVALHGLRALGIVDASAKCTAACVRVARTRAVIAGLINIKLAPKPKRKKTAIKCTNQKAA